jgi:hypothetical protein
MTKGVISSRKGGADHSMTKGVISSRKGGTDHSMTKGVISIAVKEGQTIQ